MIANKRRVQYKEALAKDRHDYDTWFDFVRMMEAEVCYYSCAQFSSNPIRLGWIRLGLDQNRLDQNKLDEK